MLRYNRYIQGRAAQHRPTIYEPGLGAHLQPRLAFMEMRWLLRFLLPPFGPHYHKRSSVESAFSMIKAKFGSAVRSKSDQGQVNEVLAKVLWHNICALIQAMHELGIEPGFGR